MKAELITSIIAAHCSGDESSFKLAVEALALDEDKKGNSRVSNMILDAYKGKNITLMKKPETASSVGGGFAVQSVGASAFAAEALLANEGALLVGVLGLALGFGGDGKNAVLQGSIDVFLLEAGQVDGQLVATVMLFDVGTHELLNGTGCRCGIEKGIERIGEERIEKVVAPARNHCSHGNHLLFGGRGGLPWLA